MIKPLRLAHVAAKAQGLALRRQVADALRRTVLGAIAAMFALGALIIAHIIGYMALGIYGHFQPIPAAAIVLGIDFVMTVIFGVLASANAVDPVLQEALRMRDQSLEQARQSLSLASMAAPLTRLVAETGLLRAAFGLLRDMLRRTPKAAARSSGK